METTVRTDVLKERMQQRGIRQRQLARLAGIQESQVCSILGGGVRVGPRVEQRLARAIIELGLDTDVPTEPKPPAAPVVIRLRHL
jgi:transcriptional regulator with XRE-family HTH domain